MNIEVCTSKISANEFMKFERENNIIFPDSYRKFLLLYNGGMIDTSYFSSDTLDFSIQYFYGITNDSYFSAYIKWKYMSDILDNTMFFPIAELEGGNVLLLSLNDKDFGFIYYWNHEDFYNRLSFVCEDFNNLLPLLTSPIEDDNLKILSSWIDPDFLQKIKKL